MRTKATMAKPVRLNQCDIEILNLLKENSEEVLRIHESLPQYSDQEISLNLSWLERKSFIRKTIYNHPAGFKTVSYQLDTAGKDYFNIAG